MAFKSFFFLNSTFARKHAHAFFCANHCTVNANSYNWSIYCAVNILRHLLGVIGVSAFLAAFKAWDLQQKGAIAPFWASTVITLGFWRLNTKKYKVMILYCNYSIVNLKTSVFSTCCNISKVGFLLKSPAQIFLFSDGFVCGN